MASEPDPRTALVPDDIDIAMERINDDFYRQRPHDYLLHRLQALLMLCGRSDVVSETLADGIELPSTSTKFQFSSWSPEPDDHSDFLTLESEVLLFQTAETLLRLVLAHAPTDGSAAAINMAALKSHREFYDRVKKVFLDSSDEALDDLVIHTVHGTDSIEPLDLAPLPGAPEGHEPTQAGLEEGRANVRKLLRHLANYVLSDNCRDIYNSAKHGLATRTGNVGFRLGGGDRPVIIDQSGEALTCVAIGRRNEHGERPVDNVTLWSNPSQATGLTHLAIQVINAVWQLGKVRHTHEEPDEGFVFMTFEGPSVETVVKLTYDLGPSRGEGPAFLTLPHMRLPTGVVI